MSQQQQELSARTAGVTRHRRGALAAGRVDRMALFDEVANLIHSTSRLAPVQTLAIVGQALAHSLALTNVVFFKRVGGQCRSLAWSEPTVTTAQRLAAREQAWQLAAELVECGMPVVGPHGASVASAAVEDVVLSVSGVLYVESARPLRDEDRWLVDQVLRLLLGVPANDPHAEADTGHEHTLAAPRRVA